MLTTPVGTSIGIAGVGIAVAGGVPGVGYPFALSPTVPAGTGEGEGVGVSVGVAVGGSVPVGVRVGVGVSVGVFDGVGVIVSVGVVEGVRVGASAVLVPSTAATATRSCEFRRAIPPVISIAPTPSVVSRICSRPGGVLFVKLANNPDTAISQCKVATRDYTTGKIASDTHFFSNGVRDPNFSAIIPAYE